jgi:hypothetical protein
MDRKLLRGRELTGIPGKSGGAFFNGEFLKNEMEKFMVLS